MKKFATSVLALSLSTILSASFAQAATYQVIDKGAASSLEYTYGKQENNMGQMVIEGTNFYNFPVQFQYLKETDYDAIVSLADSNHENQFFLENIEDESLLRAGNPTANDLAWVVLYLQNKSTDLLYQKVGNTAALINDGGETREIVIFDEKITDTGRYSRSTEDHVNGITEQGWLYGYASAPFLPLEHTLSDGEVITYWVRDYSTRGYYSIDSGETIIPIIPPESTYGGQSSIFDMSNNGYAVGFASTEVAQEAIDYINDEENGCSKPETLENQPLEVCIQQYSERNIYNAQAFKWLLDSNGVVSEQALGRLAQPEEDDPREFASYALGVNSSGVAVGYALGGLENNIKTPLSNKITNVYSVMFINDEVIPFNFQDSKYADDRVDNRNSDSRATAINDAGFAIGYLNVFVNGSERKKFYYVDTNSDSLLMNFPDGFFNGSSSEPNAINENGIIVGKGEVETHSSARKARRTHGFMYEIETDTFTDLNDFLPCLSEYTIIDANSINENNEISATAVVKTPRRNAKGELYYDESGEQVMEDVLRAVKLAPIEGEIEDCSEVEEKIERQGASTSYTALLGLFLLGLVRRKGLFKQK
ncbi:DUF3466 family protein [Thalassotalea ganghwensis]